MAVGRSLDLQPLKRLTQFPLGSASDTDAETAYGLAVPLRPLAVPRRRGHHTRPTGHVRGHVGPTGLGGRHGHRHVFHARLDSARRKRPASARFAVVVWGGSDETHGYRSLEVPGGREHHTRTTGRVRGLFGLTVFGGRRGACSTFTWPTRDERPASALFVVVVWGGGQ